MHTSKDRCRNASTGRRFGARRAAALALAGLAASVAILGPLGPDDGLSATARAAGVPLEQDEVMQIISRAVRYAERASGRPKLTIAVVDTEGNGLGVFHMSGVPPMGALNFVDPNSRQRRAARALAKAGTAAYFSSDEESFTTRTAAFIIEDHYPPGLRFAPGGPLYGVEFSNIGTSDVNPATLPPVPRTVTFETRIRGELGAIALYKDGRRVGAMGIDDGDKTKQISITDRTLFLGGCENDYRLTYANLENGRVLERIAFSAVRPWLPPARIRATQVTVDGIRLPFVNSPGLPRIREVPPVVVGPDGDFDAGYPLRGADQIPSRFQDFSLDPPPGSGSGQKTYRGQRPIAFDVIDSTDGNLTADDVRRILWQGARRADITRGAIRRPIGLPMQCWITVVDTNGAVLGVFRFKEDATLFSYDVAVQKARTAMFFSDSKVAWSTRGVGLFSQGFYPAGQQGNHRGPLHQLQDGITVGLLTRGIPEKPAEGDDTFPLRNGITIFAGGVPLYRDGELIGGVGVSGDGIDQDDIVATFASEGYGAPRAIRCDAVDTEELRASLLRALTRLEGLLPPNPDTCSFIQGPEAVGLTFLHDKIRDTRHRVRATPFSVGPSYVKFPRHPGPVTIR